MISTVLALSAEIIVITVAVLIYVVGAFVPWRRAWAWVALAGLGAAAVALAVTSAGGAAGPMVMDGLAFYFRWLALGVGALFALLASRPLDTPGTPEYVGSLLLVVAGTMIVAGSSELVLLFLGLELVSIPTYILLYLGRRDEASQESAAKYFYLSIFASAILLYGFSFLYGTTGSTDLRVIHDRLLQAGQSGAGLLWMARLAMVLTFAGLAFRIAAVPFHFYAPDVYQGTTHPNAGLLSVVPKAAGFAALVRLLAVTMGPIESSSWKIAAILAILTMTLGNVMALWQNNLRRLLAYSSIAHAGYMLIGLSVYLASTQGSRPTWDGAAALLLYLLVYSVATIGTFAALECLAKGPRAVNTVDELAGLAWTEGPIRPLLAWSMAAFLFSLAGIPPLAGFWGKLVIFASALGVEGGDSVAKSWFIALAVIGVLNAATAAAYYLRVVGVMFFRAPSETPRVREHTGGTITAVVLCALLAVVIGLSPAMWVDNADQAIPAGPSPPLALAPGNTLTLQRRIGRLPSLPLSWEATDCFFGNCHHYRWLQ